MSTVWLIRAGRKGRDQDFAVENNCAVVGWGEVGDLSGKSIGAVKDVVREQRYGYNDWQVDGAAWQLWHFANTVQKRDWVILPLMGKSKEYCAVGKIAGDYRYVKSASQGCNHRRRVSWKDKQFPDEAIPHPLTNQATVSRIKKSNLVARALEGRKDNASGDARVKQSIMREFKAHDMEGLIVQIFLAMGYECASAPKGADGGIDINVTHPSDELVDPLCVQVKNTQGSKGSPDIQRLVGAMSEQRVHKGLYVSMGGFGGDKRKKALRERFPHIRLWNADDVLRLVREHYSNFEDEDCKRRLAECGISAAGSVQ